MRLFPPRAAQSAMLRNPRESVSRRAPSVSAASHRAAAQWRGAEFPVCVCVCVRDLIARISTMIICFNLCHMCPRGSRMLKLWVCE